MSHAPDHTLKMPDGALNEQMFSTSVAVPSGTKYLPTSTVCLAPQSHRTQATVPCFYRRF
jgi:hypothetical protein